MTFDVFNLTEHTGSEVRCSVDELLTPSVAKALRKLVLHRGVLVFKSLHLSGEQQVRLAAMLGSVRDEGEQGIYKITLDKRVNKAADYLKGSFLWHMDATHDRIPVFGSLLTSRKLSRLGGQTEFANSYAAYEALPDVSRTRIAHLKAVHSVEVSMTRAGVEASEEKDPF